MLASDSIRTLRFRLLVGGLVMPALVAGCDRSSGTPEGHSFTRSVENGVAVHTSSSVPKFPVPLFRYEEAARLRQDEDNDESLLYRADRFLIGEDGRYYVGDGGNSRVAVFGVDGAFEQAIGREGEGPGEFRRLELLKVTEGEVLAYDSRLRRLSVFDTRGRLLATHSSPVGGSSVTDLYPLRGGDYLLFTTTRQGGLNEDRVTTPVAMRVSSQGDTLFQLTTRPYVLVRTALLSNPTAALQIVHSFPELGGFHFIPGRGFLAYQTGERELRWYDLEGRLDSVIRMDIEREPVTEEERAAILARLDQHITEARDERSRVMAEATREGTRIPEYKPYWTTVQVEENGHIWLSSAYNLTAFPADTSAVSYRLLSPEGEYLGDTTPPDRGGTFSRGHYVVGRTDPETGESDYIFYRLVSQVTGMRYPE